MYFNFFKQLMVTPLEHEIGEFGGGGWSLRVQVPLATKWIPLLNAVRTAQREIQLATCPSHQPGARRDGTFKGDPRTSNPKISARTVRVEGSDTAGAATIYWPTPELMLLSFTPTC